MNYIFFGVVLVIGGYWLERLGEQLGGWICDLFDLLDEKLITPWLESY